MRIWYPIGVEELDDKRLLGEHNEIHIIGKAVYAIKHDLKYGYKHHPEVIRWSHHTFALKRRHDQLAEEMAKRGFNHHSPWLLELIDPADSMDWPNWDWEPFEEKRRKLDEKQRRTG